MSSLLRIVFGASLIAGISTTAVAQDLSGSWQIDVQDKSRKTVTTLIVQFTQQVVQSCLDEFDVVDRTSLQWRRLVVKSKSTRDPDFFPAGDPLAFALKGNSLTVGRVEVCDGYLLLRGALSRRSATGRFVELGFSGERELGFFRLTKKQ